MALSNGLNKLPAGHAALVVVRGKATGNNSIPYIPHDTGFTRESINEVLPTPPLIPEVKIELVNSIDEVKADMPPMEDVFCTTFGKSMPTIHDDKDPARDLANFPRPKPSVYPEATRLVFFPDSWFRAMYPKTGVTGPYVLTAGVITYLLSKEIIIWEAEMNAGAYLCATIAFACYKFGPKVHDYLQRSTDTHNWLWYSWQQDAIAKLNEIVNTIKQNQDSLKGQEILFDAKRENVALQREAEYRRRLKLVYEEVKRKLDYQLASDQAKKQFEQSHMVNWILKSVEEAVAKQNEKEVLSKCISDLKSLSAAKKNVI